MIHFDSKPGCGLRAPAGDPADVAEMLGAVTVVLCALAGLVIGAALPRLALRLLEARRPLRDEAGAPEIGPTGLRPVGASETAGAALAGAAAFATIAASEPRVPELAALLPFAAACLLVSLTDLRARLIPDVVTAPAAVYGLAAALSFRPGEPVTLLAAGAIAFGCLFVLALISPRGLGMGDVKLGGLIGLYIGPAVAPALFIGIGLGAAAGIAIALRHGVARARRTTLAFGPLLSLGALAGIVAGPELIDAYLTTLE